MFKNAVEIVAERLRYAIATFIILPVIVPYIQVAIDEAVLDDLTQEDIDEMFEDIVFANFGEDA